MKEQDFQIDPRGPDGADGLTIVRLADRPGLLDAAAEWFASKWRVPVEAYRESIRQSFSAAVSSWYLCLSGETIVAGLGILGSAPNRIYQPKGY